MRPSTIRRLLVFGVCLVGVGCLYLVPSRAGAPSRAGSTAARTDFQTVSAPSPTPVSAISAEPTSSWTEGGHRAVAGTPTRPTVGDRSAADAGAPPTVGRLTLVSADADRVVISWPEVDDDDLVGYEVWLNGFFVVTVQQARASLAWFNDSDIHVIQVRALDATGHEGPSSPVLLVTRPTPTPEPPPPSSTPSTTSPSTTTTTNPSPAPLAHDDDAGAALDQTIADPASTTAEAGGKEDHP